MEITIDISLVSHDYSTHEIEEECGEIWHLEEGVNAYFLTPFHEILGIKPGKVTLEKEEVEHA